MNKLIKVLHESGYDTLYHGHPDGIFAFTLEGQIVDCNEAVLTMTGATKKELLERTFEPIIDPTYWGRRGEILATAAKGETTHYVTRAQSKSGYTFFAEVTNIPIRDRHGDVVGVIGIAHDVTDLRHALDQVDASHSISKIAGKIARFASWQYDIAKKELQWSDELFEILAMDPRNMPTYDEALEKLYGENSRSEFDLAVRSCAIAGTPVDLQTKVRDGTGQELDIRILAEAVRDESGAIVRVDGALYDISSLAQQREELFAMERRIAETLNELGSAIFFVDRNWRITFANRAGLNLTQMTEEVLEANTIWDLFPEILNKKFNGLFRAAMDKHETGSETEFIEQFQRYFEETVFPTAEGIIISVRDVTAEQEARHKIDDYTQRVTFLAQMLNLAQNAMIVREFDKGITFWNKSAEEMYGRTFEEVQGKSTIDVLFSDPDEARGSFEGVMRDGFWIGETVHTTKDGRKLNVDCRLQLIRDAKGEPMGVFCVNTDITAFKREEEERTRAQRMESIGTLAGGIAHDLNNVLTPILMSLELLSRDERNERKRELIASMEGSVKRGADMIRQVLAFAKGVEGERESLSLGVLLAEVSQFCRDTLPKNIDVTFDYDDDLRPVIGDATQLMQVLINLITNARDAMPGGGDLTVRARNSSYDVLSMFASGRGVERGGIAIEVIDTGSGMSTSVASRIFEPFFTTKQFGEGTGLGLSTSLAIAKSHGGRIEVESVPGQGTTFQLLLPAEEPPTPKVPVTPSRETVSLEGAGRRVLIVDDEAPILMMLNEVLRSEGFDVEVAQNGAAALRTIEQSSNPYELIITDLNMPQLSGEQFANVVRERHPEVNFVFMSGVNASASLLREVDGVRSHFIQKPFSMAALLALMEIALA